MSITFACDCGRVIAVPGAVAGKMVQCPGCGAGVRVPRSSTAVSATPSAPLGGGPRALETSAYWRAVVGATAGSLLAASALDALGGSRWPQVAGCAAVVAGAAAGSYVASAFGMLASRGKAGAVLMGGAVGAVFGTFVGVALTLYFIGSPRALMPAFCGPILVGAVIGGIAGRVRHRGRMTIAELSAWVAAAACVLAIARALMS